MLVHKDFKNHAVDDHEVGQVLYLERVSRKSLGPDKKTIVVEEDVPRIFHDAYAVPATIYESDTARVAMVGLTPHGVRQWVPVARLRDADGDELTSAPTPTDDDAESQDDVGEDGESSAPTKAAKKKGARPARSR
jgi:hypothetical protein